RGGGAVPVGHEADAAGVTLVAAPVVQAVLRHLASEGNCGGGRREPTLDNDVRGHENGAAWGERRCSSNMSLRRWVRHVNSPAGPGRAAPSRCGPAWTA